MHAERFWVCLISLCATVPATAATWTVTGTGDAGDGTCDATCTLRDAVDAAGTDDRILFDLALTPPVLIGLTGPALQIHVPLRITATDGVRTTVRRVAGTGRLMEVLGNGDARVIGLSFENGSAPASIGTSADGGAIHVAAGAALELRDCVLRGNHAVGASSAPATQIAGSPARGGAIFAAGTLLLENCAFVDNHATGGDGASNVLLPGSAGGSASGGALHATAGIDIVNSTFSGNSATGGAGGTGGMGAIGMSGFAGGDGGTASGGAIAFAATAAPTVAFATLLANEVAGGSGGIGGPGGPPLMPGDPPPPNGEAGADGTATGAAIDTAAATILNVSVVAANIGAAQCSGAALSARTSNLVADASCPGVVVAALETQFEAIDLMADSPHYRPLFDSVAVDAAADCLDAVAFEAVVLDQLLTPRPLRVTAATAKCDIGAIELNPVLFGDGFEEPPPPP